MNTREVLTEFGARIRRLRLNRNKSQKEIAERAGIGINSVARLEDGKGATLAHFIRVLNALDAMEHLDHFLPEPPISPIQLAKLHGKIRRRASKRTAESPDFYSSSFGTAISETSQK